jgi:hypothetical protein
VRFELSMKLRMWSRMEKNRTLIVLTPMSNSPPSSRRTTSFMLATQVHHLYVVHTFRLDFNRLLVDVHFNRLLFSSRSYARSTARATESMCIVSTVEADCNGLKLFSNPSCRICYYFLKHIVNRNHYVSNEKKDAKTFSHEMLRNQVRDRNRS